MRTVAELIEAIKEIPDNIVIDHNGDAHEFTVKTSDFGVEIETDGIPIKDFFNYLKNELEIEKNK